MWNGAPRGSTLFAADRTSWKAFVVVKAPSVTACRCAKSITGRTQGSARRDVDDVVEAPDLADAPHDLDAERDPAALALEPCPQVGELLDDLGERAFARALEQEAGMEDDRLGTGCHRDPGRVVEHPGRHRMLSVALDVTHEPGDRRVHATARSGDGARGARTPRPTGSPSRSRPRSRSRRRCSRARGGARPPPRGSPGKEREPGHSGVSPRPKANRSCVVRRGS